MQAKTKMSPLKAFLQGTLILTISNVVLKAINFFLLPLYTAYLTPEQLGINDTIINLTSLIFTILVLAFDSAYSAFYYDDDTQEHRDRVFNTVLFTFMGTSSIALGLILFADDISMLVFGTSEYVWAIRIALMGVALNLWFLPFSLDCRIQSKMTAYAGITVSSSLVMIILNILFVVVLGLGFYALIISLALSNLFQLILYCFIMKKRFSIRLFDKRLFRQMLKYSLPMLPSVLAYWIINLSCTYIILLYFSTTEVGIYGIAARYVTVVNVVANAFYLSFSPYAFQSAQDEGAPEKFRTILNVFFLLISIIVFSTVVFGKEVITLMTTPAYYEAYLLLPGLMFGQLAYGVATVVGYGIAITKKSIFNMIAVLTSAGVSLAMNFLLIPHLGALGATYATCISYCTMTLLLYIFAERLYPCRYQIGKVGLCFFVLLGLCMISLDFPLWQKCIIWVMGTALVVGVFRKSLGDAWIAVKRLLPRQT